MKISNSTIDALSPIFIFGHRRSGATLFSALLDYHPELLVYPDESKFFYLFYPVIAKSDQTVDEKIQHIVSKNFQYLENVLVNTCEADSNYIDMEELSYYLTDYVVNSSTSGWDKYLMGMIYAFSCVTPQSLNHVNSWVEKTSSTEIYAVDIFEKFPNAKCVHVVRDPRDNYASLKSGWESRYQHLSDSTSLEMLMQTMIDRAGLGFKCGKNNYEQLGKNRYKYVRYEDLVTSTKNTMKEISDFLEIEFDNSLLKPTFCGLDWPGNQFSGEPQQGVNSDGMGSWEHRITEREAVLLEFFFEDYMKQFNYSTKFTRRDSMKAASSYYKWLNFESDRRGDHSLATKTKI